MKNARDSHLVEQLVLLNGECLLQNPGISYSGGDSIAVGQGKMQPECERLLEAAAIVAVT